MFLSKGYHGYWYIYYDTPDGLRRKVSTHTKQKTEALKLLRSFNPPQETQANSTKITTLSEFRTMFLEYAQTRYRPNTYRGTFKMAWNEFIRISGDVDIRTVDERIIEMFLSTKIRETSLHAARHCYGALASSFQTAYRWKIIPRNPWREVRKPKAPDVHPLFLSEKEVGALLDAITDPFFKRLCLFALSTGVRISEAIALQWDAVDLERRVVHIQNTATFITKSMKNRVIPMSDSVFSLLSQLPRREGSVFLTHYGTPWSRDRATRWFKIYASAAGLNSAYHFHTLRHTFASWLAQRGANLYEIKELLGHQSITTTQIYAHLQPEKLHATVNRISLPLNSGKPDDPPTPRPR